MTGTPDNGNGDAAEMLKAGWIILSTTWLIQAIYGAVKPWITVSMMECQRARFRNGKDARRPRLALIVAAKGLTPEFPRFLELVTHQNYPAYRLIFATESADDPAAIALRKFLGLSNEETVWRPAESKPGIQEIRLSAAGEATNCGQKVFNQLAAFRELEPADEIIAFADADIVGGGNWLEQLVMPLILDEGDLSTGYRWFFPRSASLSDAVATNINAAIAIMNGPSFHTLMWGGSMALTRACFDELRVPELLEGCLNDDLTISDAARRAGKRFEFVRPLMAASPVHYTWKGLFEFGRRQYFQVRVYVPAFWWTALGLTTLWCLSMVWNWAALLLGHWEAAPVIASVVLLDWIRSFSRTRYLKHVFSPEQRSQLRGARRWEWWTTWLNMLVHWAVIVSTFPIREITWAGIRYRVDGPRKVKVLSR